MVPSEFVIAEMNLLKSVKKVHTKLSLKSKQNKNVFEPAYVQSGVVDDGEVRQPPRKLTKQRPTQEIPPLDLAENEGDVNMSLLRRVSSQAVGDRPNTRTEEHVESGVAENTVRGKSSERNDSGPSTPPRVIVRPRSPRAKPSDLPSIGEVLTASEPSSPAYDSGVAGVTPESESTPPPRLRPVLTPYPRPALTHTRTDATGTTARKRSLLQQWKVYLAEWYQSFAQFYKTGMKPWDGESATGRRRNRGASNPSSTTTSSSSLESEAQQPANVSNARTEHSQRDITRPRRNSYRAFLNRLQRWGSTGPKETSHCARGTVRSRSTSLALNLPYFSRKHGGHSSSNPDAVGEEDDERPSPTEVALAVARCLISQQIAEDGARASTPTGPTRPQPAVQMKTTLREGARPRPTIRRTESFRVLRSPHASSPPAISPQHAELPPITSPRQVVTEAPSPSDSVVTGRGQLPTKGLRIADSYCDILERQFVHLEGVLDSSSVTSSIRTSTTRSPAGSSRASARTAQRRGSGGSNKRSGSRGSASTGSSGRSSVSTGEMKVRTPSPESHPHPSGRCCALGTCASGSSSAWASCGSQSQSQTSTSLSQLGYGYHTSGTPSGSPPRQNTSPAAVAGPAAGTGMGLTSDERDEDYDGTYDRKRGNWRGGAAQRRLAEEQYLMSGALPYPSPSPYPPSGGSHPDLHPSDESLPVIDRPRRVMELVSGRAPLMDVLWEEKEELGMEGRGRGVVEVGERQTVGFGVKGAGGMEDETEVVVEEREVLDVVVRPEALNVAEVEKRREVRICEVVEGLEVDGEGNGAVAAGPADEGLGDGGSSVDECVDAVCTAHRECQSDAAGIAS